MAKTRQALVRGSPGLGPISATVSPAPKEEFQIWGVRNKSTEMLEGVQKREKENSGGLSRAPTPSSSMAAVPTMGHHILPDRRNAQDIMVTTTAAT